MKTLSFSRTALAILVTAAAYAFATPAHAEDPSCTGYCQNPAPGTGLSFTVNAGAAFSGFGSANHLGNEGYSFVEKIGGAMSEVKLNADGDFCGPSCQNGGYTAKAESFESVLTKAGAMSTTSGAGASAINAGQAISGANITIMKAPQ